jgi:uncharacterized protein
MVEHGDPVARDHVILRTVVGSGVHGIAILGQDDHDEMGVFIEPRDHVYGTRRPVDTYTWRTQPEGARSGPGDTDLVLYSLRHYVGLAAKGNPTALLPLWAPDQQVLDVTDEGRRLRNIRQAFMSQQAVHRFLGYMHAQHERMLGGGKRNRVPNRPELIARHGYDTKFASHALRLAYQGHEVAVDGRLTLPMPDQVRDNVLAVKRGAWSQQRVSDLIVELTAHIETVLRTTCPLPEQPDWERINAVMIRLHEQHWNPRRASTSARVHVFEAPPSPSHLEQARLAYEHGRRQGRHEAGG